MTTTGERLKELRKNRGWSQSDVAKRIGVGRTTYLKYETGENKPVRKIRELAELFGVSYDYLLDNEDTEHEYFSEDETKLIYKYRQLNSARKQLVEGMIYQFGVDENKKDVKSKSTSIIQNNHHNSGGTNILNVN